MAASISPWKPGCSGRACAPTAHRPGFSLTGSAYFTDVSEDGTLGYNYGRYEFRDPGAEGKEIVRGGWFLTLWKRQPDGSWKYVMDNGTPDKPAPKPPGG